MTAFDSVPTENVDDLAMRYMRNVGELLFAQKDTIRPILVGEHADVFFNKLTGALRESIMSQTEVVFPGAKKNTQYRLMCWYSASAIVGFLKGCIYDVDISKDVAIDTLCTMHAPSFAVGVDLLRD